MWCFTRSSGRSGEGREGKVVMGEGVVMEGKWVNVGDGRKVMVMEGKW